MIRLDATAPRCVPLCAPHPAPREVECCSTRFLKIIYAAEVVKREFHRIPRAAAQGLVRCAEGYSSPLPQLGGLSRFTWGLHWR